MNAGDPGASIRIWDLVKLDSTHSCGCIGPQNGEPLCPCMMRGVQIKDGRYVRVEDLGPAPGPNAKIDWQNKMIEMQREYNSTAAKWLSQR
ncbi:hypothetical protein ACN6KF_003035 [Labrys sp. La1]|uniref:hypothetical protein n=1 Tax=Labrys sp. La1 TaxID=3404917 RepID=UPI003EB9D76E